MALLPFSTLATYAPEGDQDTELMAELRTETTTGQSVNQLTCRRHVSKPARTRQTHHGGASWRLTSETHDTVASQDVETSFEEDASRLTRVSANTRVSVTLNVFSVLMSYFIVGSVQPVYCWPVI